MTASGNVRAIWRAVPIATLVAGVLSFFLLPVLGQAIWGPGHPDGQTVGLLLWLGLAEILGIAGALSAVIQLWSHRRLALWFAVLANLMLAATPALILWVG